MFRFFRKIKQKLLRKNTITKYMLYAAGEIVLVVIGILVALQINDWNDGRKDRKLESLYLARLQEDLEEEESYIESFIKYNLKVNRFANEAIDYFENSALAFQNPNKSLIALYQASQFNDARTTAATYQELNASGQINLVSDQALRSSIISYYELDWTNSVIFEIPNHYRVTLRSIMPNAIQKEIRKNCGDVYVETKRGISVEIPESCEIDVSQRTATEALEQLLNNKSLEQDLNFLIGNMDSKLAYMTYIHQKLKELLEELEKIRTNLNTLSHDWWRVTPSSSRPHVTFDHVSA